MSTLVLSITIILNAGVIKNDFLVNPDSPNKCQKYSGTVAATPHGWFVVWEDTRNARNNEVDILGQFLSTDLVSSGSNRMITSDSTHKGEILLCAASDSMGNTIVMWQAGGDSGDFWLRKVSPSGVLLDKDTLLFSLGITGRANLAMNESGEYAITWLDPGGAIELLLFDKSGKRKTDAQFVQEGIDPGIQPYVVLASNGASIVIWYNNAETNTQTGIYGRCYNTKGEPRGDVFKVAEFSNPDFPPFVTSIAVGCDHAGKFVISWVLNDMSSLTPYALYYRTYAWDGTAKDPAKIIYKFNDQLLGISQHSMVVGWDGSFSVAWSDQRSGHYRSYLQNFFADGSLRGQEMTISEQRTENCILKALALNADQWFAVYSRERYGFSELLGRKGMVYGSIIGNETLITDDENSIFETLPQVLADDQGNFTAFWSEDWYRAPAYCRRFSNDGESLSDTLPLKDTSGINRLLPQYYARASMNRKNGEFVLVWKVSSDPPQIRAQRYTSEGYPSGNEKKISNVTSANLNFFKAYCNVSMNRKGAFAAAWIDSNEVYVKRFDKDNVAVDDTDIVMGIASASPAVYSPPAIGLKDDGGFVVAWQDQRGGIWMKRFNSTPKALAEEGIVNDGAASSQGQKPALAIDNSGNFCIAWADYAHIFVQFYDASGTKLGENKNTGIRLGGNPFAYLGREASVVALPGGGFVVYGTDYSNSEDNPDVSAVYYHSDGTGWSRKMQINEPDQFCFHSQVANYNSVAAAGDRIVYVWQDNRRHKGWDIYAKIYDLDITGISEPSPSPSSPVTPVTHQIDLESGIGSTITLRYSDFPEGLRASVYDASGRRVDQLYTSQKQGTIQWGQDRAPGVYFIVPEALTRRPLKVVLVR